METIGAFYTYFSNQTHRPRLEKRVCLEGFLEVQMVILNYFWIQMAVSLQKPPCGGFRSRGRSEKNMFSAVVFPLLCLKEKAKLI
jgi:hypothetical protein